MNRFIAFAAIVVLLSACEEKTFRWEEEHTSSTIRFGAQVGGKTQTKAPVETDENGLLPTTLDGIQILRGNDGLTPAFHTLAAPATTGKLTANGTLLTPATPQTFNALHDDAHFMAFYPAATQFEAGKASFVIDGQQDIIVAAPQSVSYERDKEAAVNLYFEHQLVWVKLKIKSADENAAISFGNLLSSKITVPNEMELLIRPDGNTSFSVKENSDTMTLDFGSAILTGDHGMEEDEDKGIILPNSFLVYPPGDDFSISLTFQNRPGESFLINGITQTPGTKCFIMVRLQGTQFEFSGVTVEDWKEVENWDWDDESNGLIPVN